MWNNSGHNIATNRPNSFLNWWYVMVYSSDSSLGVTLSQWKGEESQSWWIWRATFIKSEPRATWWVGSAVRFSHAWGSLPLLGPLQGAQSRQPLWYIQWLKAIEASYPTIDNVLNHLFCFLVVSGFWNTVIFQVSYISLLLLVHFLYLLYRFYIRILLPVVSYY